MLEGQWPHNQLQRPILQPAGRQHRRMPHSTSKAEILGTDVSQPNRRQGRQATDLLFLSDRATVMPPSHTHITVAH